MVDFDTFLEYTIELELDSGVTRTFIVAVQASHDQTDIDGRVIMESLMSTLQDPYGVFVYYDPESEVGSLLRASKVQEAHIHPDICPYQGILALPGLVDF